MNQRIVITGAGVVSAIGIGKEENLQSLRSMREGVAPVRYLQTDHKECMVGEVKMTNQEMMQRLGIEPETAMVRTSLLGMLALDEALLQAGLNEKALAQTAFINGTTVGGMDMSEQHYLEYLSMSVEEDSQKPSVEYIRTHDCGSSTDLIADHFGRFAMTTSISTACSSAANSLILGVRMIESGEYDRVVVGGAESLSKFHLNGFNTLMILDREQCRPFDASRAGLNLGEGAAFLILESEESARRRGIEPIAVLSGYGNACDAFHQTASSADGEGAFLAMTKALRMGGIQPSEVGYINAHGTGTPNNDASESAAMMRVFGDDVPPVSSTKSFTGHTTSASGSIESVICLLAMEYGFIPASLGWKEPSEGCIVPVSEVREGVSLNHVLCNSFGFGGNDSSLLFSKP